MDYAKPSRSCSELLQTQSASTPVWTSKPGSDAWGDVMSDPGVAALRGPPGVQKYQPCGREPAEPQTSARPVDLCHYPDSDPDYHLCQYASIRVGGISIQRRSSEELAVVCIITR